MLSDLLEHGQAMRSLSPPRSSLGLFCMASGAGYELRVNEVYSWDGLKRGTSPFVLIQHTIAGRGRLDFAGANHVLTPGRTMLLTFPHANRYWLERGQSWEYFWIILTGREALRLAGAIIEARGPILSPSPAIIDRLADACLRLLRPGELSAGDVSAAAYSAMMGLHDEAYASPAAAPAMPAAIQRSIAFAEANLARSVDVGAMARAAQLSRAHFVRLFTAHAGIPPSDFVFSRRIERAERLLHATDMSVGAIAQACGFPDANYFGKAFRRAHGISPGTFRHAGRQGLDIGPAGTED